MRLVEYLAAEFKKENQIDLRGDKLALQRLKESAEKARSSCRPRSRPRSPAVHLHEPADAVAAASDDEADARQAESLVDDLIERTKGPCQQRSGRRAEGGGHRRGRARRRHDAHAKVQQIVKELFGKEPHKGVNPDEVVAVGAAIQGGVLKGDVKDVLLLT